MVAPKGTVYYYHANGKKELVFESENGVENGNALHGFMKMETKKKKQFMKMEMYNINKAV